MARSVIAIAVGRIMLPAFALQRVQLSFVHAAHTLHPDAHVAQRP